MNTLAIKTVSDKRKTTVAAGSQAQSSGKATFQFKDNRPETVTQRKLQEMANNSPQTTQSAPIQMARKSLRARVLEKLKREGYANLTTREKRFVRKPPRGQVRPTVDELQQGRQNLKRTDYGVVNPNLQNIRTRRGVGQSPEHFADHLQDVRRSTTELMSQPVGARMLTEINSRQAQVNPLALPGQPQPTMVDIYSGRGLDNDSKMSHRPRHDGTLGDVRKGYRFDGVAGTGQASRINYDESSHSPNRGISLGHEMVHAWRTAHGLGVAPPQVSPQRNAAILNTPGDDQRIIEQAVELHAQKQEEFETVGLAPTPHAAWAPTENLIRAEQGRAARNDYSGSTPGDMDGTITNLDDATDDRGWWDKNVRNKPHPHHVKNLLHHLED